MKITETESYVRSKNAGFHHRKLASLVRGMCRKFNLRSRSHRGCSNIHKLVDGGFLGFGGTVVCVVYEIDLIRCVKNQLGATMIIANHIEEWTDKEVEVVVTRADEI